MGGFRWAVGEAGALSTAWADNGAFVTCEDAMSLPFRPVIAAWPLLLALPMPALAADTIGEVDTVFK
jgi:hypothetical protein